jgi:predicted dehydrogenase/Xaa-Pro aminopeptidase/putative sterol carrier protein
MELRGGSPVPVDEKIYKKCAEKIKNGTVREEDLDEIASFFAGVCNSHDDIKYEMREMTQVFQFNLDHNRIYTLVFGKGGVEVSKGAAEKPTVIFFISAATVLDIVAGRVYSSVAQMAGDIKYTGPRPDAIACQRIIELFLDLFLRRDVEALKEAAAKQHFDKKKVKFGIIGAGLAFHFHSNGDRGSDSIAYTAVYDRDFENAKKMALRYQDGIMVPYETLEEMLASDIDAVLVMVPHEYHVEMVVKAARAGKHVLCEKPMATTVEGCRQMIRACKDAGVKLMIAENHRFIPAHVYMHNIVRQGLIGDVLMVRAYEGVNEVSGMMRSGFWKGDPIKAGGGAFMDMGAHKWAAIEYIIGSKCTKVTAAVAKQAVYLPEKGEDNAVAIAHYENGAIADVMVSFTQMTTPYNSMEIFGTKGSIFENHDWLKPVRFCSFDERMGDQQQKWVEPDIEHAAYPEYYTISVRETDKHFAQCILENRDPEFTPEQSMNAIAANLAGYLSAIEGRPVEILEVEKMADTERTVEILERLAPAIPIHQRLPQVKVAEPIGYNKKRAAAVMEKYNLDLLIAASPVNVYYLSGLPLLHSSPNPILLALNNQYPNLAMILREGDGALIHWNVFKSASTFSWFTDTVGIESQAEVGLAIGSKIRQWGLVGKRVGVESTTPKYLVDALSQENNGVTIINADEAFLDLRLVKTPLEIEYLQKAADITEAALKDTIAAVKEGVTDWDLLRTAKESLIKHGADDWDHLTMTIGDSDPEAPGTGRAVKKGEIVRLDFGGIYRGYVADINQEVVVGEAPPEADRLIQGLLDFQRYFEERIKPGVNMKALSDEAVAWYKKAVPHGIAFSIGHSIGLQCEDQHIFGAFGQLDRSFEENMVFEIEAWEPYKGALIGVEDCYVVTKEGCRKMTTMPKHIMRV